MVCRLSEKEVEVITVEVEIQTALTGNVITEKL